MALKDKIEGNELDLSLNQLVDVPVKELAASTKATHLDLSCNHIQTLPSNFASLTHLVKLDLSKNRLTELPHNFGNLINLQYFDLYGNQISNLPLSFCRLKILRWLDLKNNPLDSKLKAIAGDCLDEKQCQMCAKKVVGYMQTIESDLEREKQKKLKVYCTFDLEDLFAFLEKEAVRRAKADKELEDQRRKKKAEKEKRKAESKAKREEELIMQRQANMLDADSNDSAKTTGKARINNQNKKGFHWFTVILLFLAVPLLVVATIVGFGILRGHTLHDVSVADLQVFAMESLMELRDATAVWWSAIFLPFAVSMKANVLQGIHSTLIYVTDVANSIDLSSFK